GVRHQRRREDGPDRRRQDFCAFRRAGAAYPHRRNGRGSALVPVRTEVFRDWGRQPSNERGTMTKTGRYTRLAGMAGLAVLAMSAPAFAQEAEEAFTLTAPETAYIFNTLLFLIGGFLVMWMAAGFAMLEAGLVRSKNVAMQCTKNISLFSIATIMYYLVGYNLMYSG